MIATAKHNVKYQGVWRRSGEKFHVDDIDAEMMAVHAALDDEPEPAEPEAEQAEEEQPVKRTRRRRTEE